MVRSGGGSACWNPQIVFIRSNNHLSIKSLSVTSRWHLLLNHCQDNRSSWAGLRCGDGKETWIIGVKSLLLPPRPARPMVIKETCRWDPRVSSCSLPASTEVAGTPRRYSLSKIQSATGTTGTINMIYKSYPVEISYLCHVYLIGGITGIWPLHSQNNEKTHLQLTFKSILLSGLIDEYIHFYPITVQMKL